jgi:acetolactate synthase-1/2/3 large subunit
MNCAQATMALLRAYDTDVVFGIPGVHTLEFMRELEKTGVRQVVPRHEQGAGFMADGYARVTRRPGVCLLITGPGLTNALTPIAQAYADSVPMLVISTVVASGDIDRGRGLLHDLPSQRRLMEQVTASSTTVREPGELNEVFARAFACLRSARPRPVHIEIPIDVAAEPAEPIAVYALPDRPPPSARSLDHAAQLLSGAERPLIVVGGGAAHAGPEIDRLATALDAPFVTTTNAKGVLPDDHPLSLACTLPLPATHELVERADVVLAVGTELSPIETLYSGNEVDIPGQLIRLDIDRTQLTAPEPACALLGDARAGLGSIADRIIPRAARQASVEVDAARSEARKARAEDEFGPWYELLGRVLPEDAIVVLDSAQFAYAAPHFVEGGDGRSWLAPYSYGTLGCALPMAIGAKVGEPDRPVVFLAGDGGLQFTLQELATAAAECLPIVALIWDNAAYGEIRKAMTDTGIAPTGVEIPGPDLLGVARGLGWDTDSCGGLDEAEGAIRSALVSERPIMVRLNAEGDWRG